MISSFPPPSLTPARLYERFSGTPREIDADLEVIAGELPRSLAGVLLRNSPGRVTAHGRPYDHPFDGDGMMHGFYLEGGRARYRNRWVKTKEFLEEERAGRALYRNFGTNRPGGRAKNILRTRFKNPANTSVVHHAGRLFALWEGGLPHAMDLQTLRTLGRYDFDGVLSGALGPVDRILSPEAPFGAHPKLDPRTGELVSFGLARGVRPKLYIWSVSSDGVMAPPRAIVLDELAYVHDFAITERFLVFVLLPMAFDTAKMLLGRATAVQSLELRREASTIVVVPRDGGAASLFEAGPLYAFHHVNAYDDGAEIVLESLVMDTPPPIAEMAGVFAGEHPYPDARLTRLRIDPARRAVTSRETLLERPMEFATVAAEDVSRPTKVLWGVGSAEGADEGAEWHSRKRARSPAFTGIVRVDLAARRSTFLDFGHDFPSEPVHVRTSDGTDLLLTVVYRSKNHRSELHVLDANDLSTRATLAIAQHVPPSFHGCFVENAPNQRP